VASISETGTEKKKTTTGYYMPEDLFLYVYIRGYGRSIAAMLRSFYVGEKKSEVKFIKNILKIFFMSQIAGVCVA